MGQQQIVQPKVALPNLIGFQSHLHQFQSKNIQRLKQTPFALSVLCSSDPLIYSDPVQITLQALLEPRLNTKKLFPKIQILQIIQSMFGALRELRQRNFQHYGNISLESIYYCKNSKFFKLINPAFYQSTNFLLAKQGLKFSFLSPEQLLAMIQQQEEQEVGFQSDIFVLGICLLQICTLRDSRQIYCPDTYNILDMEITNRLEDVEQYYEPQLVGFLKKCLTYESQHRITIDQAMKRIDRLIQIENNPINQPQRKVSAQQLNNSKSSPNLPQSGRKPQISPAMLPRRN